MADHDPMQPVGGSPLAPAAPISPQEIAEMRRALSLVTFLHPNGWYRDGKYVRSASTGQLLMHAETCGVNDVQFAADAPKRVERLLDANQRLTDALNTSVLEACEEIDDRLKPEIERLTDRLANAADGMAYWRRIAQRFRELLVDENAVEAISRDDWYAAERHHFEAAHAAAKDDGIDMALLGKLCREQPDADTKREVEAMMDKLNRTETER